MGERALPVPNRQVDDGNLLGSYFVFELFLSSRILDYFAYANRLFTRPKLLSIPTANT